MENHMQKTNINHEHGIFGIFVRSLLPHCFLARPENLAADDKTQPGLVVILNTNLGNATSTSTRNSSLKP